MTPHLSVEFKLLHPDAKRPEYQTEGASGMDLHALSYNAALFWPLLDDRHWVTLDPNARIMIGTGIAIALPSGWEAQIRPRSSLSKRGILCHFGTIDADYRGELKVCLTNLSSEPYEIKRGDRIAQLVFAPVGRAALQLVERFSTETKRGEGGFGSSGK